MRRLLFLMPILLCAAVSAHAQSLDAFKQRLAEPTPGATLFNRAQVTVTEHDDAARAVADASVDVATVAFGVRNFGDLGAGLRELARTIKPGGKVVILEFSRPRNRVFRALYEFYSYKILPRIGGLVSRDKRAYEYLPASVGEFPAPEEFMAMMARTGFRNCRARSQSFGIAQIYIGER